MFQQGVDSDEGIARRNQESERVCDRREADVGCPSKTCRVSQEWLIIHSLTRKRL